MNGTEINLVIDKLAEKLAVPAEQILRAYAVQGGVYLPSLFVPLILAIIGFAISLKCTVWGFSKVEKLNSEGWGITTFLLGVCALITGVMVVAFLCDIGGEFSNYLVWQQSPESYAVLKIMQVVKYR